MTPEAATPARPWWWRLGRILWRRVDDDGIPVITENRGKVRVEIQGAATLTEMNKLGSPGRSWTVQIIDVSKGGAAVSTPIFVPPGTGVMLQLLNEDGSPGREMMARVVHIRRRDELSYAAGMKFESRAGQHRHGDSTCYYLAG